ncbi:hypothetical protein KVR01_002389 [Diaporthe batatas]|uniref:uncharacterized protein n=1 Tax=Diaporthe batatas TaxID=748121 RepID=UPI001D04FC2B|nr:uncharacterized protein KVR01_002389 [Diaporthe batatas]KAG8166700.1 hypothetical protein KVR01_002389 [Diaporthe batatas]
MDFQGRARLGSRAWQAWRGQPWWVPRWFVYIDRPVSPSARGGMQLAREAINLDGLHKGNLSNGLIDNN